MGRHERLVVHHHALRESILDAHERVIVLF